MEHKTLSLNDCEIKFINEAGHFSGYASVFNGLDSYGDTILPGAYKETLKTAMPKMFLLHNSHQLPIGKWLKAAEDEKGLFVEGELTPNMTAANDAFAALKHGTLDGLSIGYSLRKGDYSPNDKAEGGRIIKKIALLSEISPVTFPADSDARIDLSSVKSELDKLETVRDFERFLRDAGGFSKSVTEAIVMRAKLVFGQGDPGESQLSKSAIEKLMQRLDSFGMPAK